jgi:hypothetical protein
MMATDEGGATAEIERLKQECQEMKDAIKHAGLYMWPYEKGMKEGGGRGGALAIVAQKKIHSLSRH